MLFDKRSWEAWRFALTGLAGALILALGIRVRFGPALQGTAWVLAPTLLAALAVAWAFWMSVLAVRRFDEYQLAAGKFAWYWGGTLGVAVSVVGYSFVALGGLHWIDPGRFQMGRELFKSFKLGYLLGVGTPFAGFLVARLWWGLAKR